MKFKILFYAICCSLIVNSVQAQKLFPDDTLSFVKITIRNPDDTPYANKKIVLKGEKGHRVEVTTDKQGFVKATVPYKETYEVYCGTYKCRDKIITQDIPYITYTFTGYSERCLVLDFYCHNDNKQPLTGEVLTLVDSSGKEQQFTTDSLGKVTAILPLQDYTLNVKYIPNFRKFKANPQVERHRVKVDARWMGSKERDRRAALADSLARVAYADMVKMLDSLAKASKEEIITKDITIPIISDTSFVNECIVKKAAAYKEQLKRNPKFFEETKKTVLATLFRINKKFPNKIIVTDITGSMSPYMEQVLVWHALNFMEGSNLKYVFFNDGNATPDSKKMIGKTGGLYHCQGTAKDLKTIIGTMYKGIRAGGGGDAEENDLEAVLAAMTKKNKTDEIILVADNNSPVRDIALLTQIHVPVRVILCGVEKGDSFWAEVNEQYLDIAYQTGGSVHTITEDLFDLNKKVEGNTILFNGVEYILENGHFSRKSKS